jgi:histidinol phosphatase-like enzyme
MFLQAQIDLSIDLSRSVLIGDKVSDIQAGTAAGVVTNLLFAEEHPHELSGFDYDLNPDPCQSIRYLQRGLK